MRWGIVCLVLCKNLMGLCSSFVGYAEMAGMCASSALSSSAGRNFDIF